MSETDTTNIASQELEEHTGTAPDFSRMVEPEILSLIETALDRLSVESLGRIGDAVREKRQAKQEETRQTARRTIEEQLQNSGLSLRDLFPELVPTPGRKRGESGPVPPKYRGPNGETWSGRGHPPKWLSILEQAGHNREELRIQEDGQ